MHILMLSWEYPPHIVGGLGAHVAALAPALVRAGVQVEVVTPSWKGGLPVEPIVTLPLRAKPRKATRSKTSKSKTGSKSSLVHRIPAPVSSMGNFFADAQQTNLNLEEVAHQLFQKYGNIDLIHAHDWLVAFSAASLKRIHKSPLVATIHATERGRGRGHLAGEQAQAINGTEWWLTYEAWRVITASEYMADEVRDYFQVPTDKVDIIPNGVDIAPFDALEKDDLTTFRAEWAPPGQRIVFSVGRIVQEKGAHLIVEAAPRVLAQYPETRFIIAGTGSMMDSLRRRVWELGVADRVLMAGFISDEDRNRLLKVSDVAVFPSIYEPFGIVALEAMAAKCPVVATSVGGLGEVMEHLVNGVTVFPNDIDSLAWGILQVFANPLAARDRADRAYKDVKQIYSWDHIAAETIKVYERVIRERKKSDW